MKRIPGGRNTPGASPRAAARRLILLLALLVSLALPALAQASGPSVSAYDSLATLRPEQPAPAGGSPQASIAAARNETESFQLLIGAGSASITGLRVDPAETLSGPGGATIPAEDLTIYREGTYDVTQRSDAEGATGLWPDVLIPERDPLYNEARTAFPVNLPAGSQLGVWVDVLVPQGQAPGTYRGSIAVSDSAGAIATVPVSLSVADFTLPSTSALKSAFHIDPRKICTAFTGDPNCDGNQQQSWQLDSLFAELGLDNRVTISNPYPTAFNAAPTSPAEKSSFATYIAPLLEGTDPRVRLPGAKLTSFDAYWQCVTESSSCLNSWKSLASQYGFSERFFLYDCDEPSSPSAWSQCSTTAQQAEQSWPGVRKLITASAQELQANNAGSYTNIDTALVNDMVSQGVNQRPSYDSFLAKSPANELWIYSSCMSYSCNESENPAWNGWPGYAIDEPASQAQAMGWMAFAYQASGELYYETTQSLPTASTNQYYSGGNGDGNLFYAGTPNGANGSVAIGGTHPIPLETIRLKRIRDGYQNYEYLRMLEAQGKRQAAMGVFEHLFGNLDHAMNSTTVTGAALDSARAQLSAMIAPESEPTPTPTPEPTPTPAPEPTPTPTPTPEPTPTPAPEPAPAPAPEPAPTPAPTPEPAPAPTPSPAPEPAPVPAVSPPATQPLSSPALTSPTTPSPSTESPKLRVHILGVKVPKRTRQLRRRGLRALISCTARCRVEVGSVVDRSTAQRLRLGSTEVGHATALLGGGEPRWVIARPDPGADSKLVRDTGTTASLGIRALVRAHSETDGPVAVTVSSD